MAIQIGSPGYTRLLYALWQHMAKKKDEKSAKSWRLPFHLVEVGHAVELLCQDLCFLAHGLMDPTLESSGRAQMSSGYAPMPSTISNDPVL